MSTCQADCFVDTCSCRCLRPLAHPKQLVWGYFQVKGQSEGTLEQRQYQTCSCGCGNLVANPPAHLREHESLVPVPVATESPAPSDSQEVGMSATMHWVIRFAAVVIIALLLHYSK